MDGRFLTSLVLLDHADDDTHLGISRPCSLRSKAASLDIQHFQALDELGMRASADVET